MPFFATHSVECAVLCCTALASHRPRVSTSSTQREVSSALQTAEFQVAKQLMEMYTLNHMDKSGPRLKTSGNGVHSSFTTMDRTARQVPKQRSTEGLAEDEVEHFLTKSLGKRRSVSPLVKH